MKASNSLTHRHTGFLWAFVLLVTASCSVKPTADEPQTHASLDPVFAINTSADVPISSKDRARICRTFDADMGGYDPKIVKVVADNGSIVRTRYARPDDGKLWTTECRLDGKRIVWRPVDADGPRSGLGRWRNGPSDETITFDLRGESVVIRTNWQDGSSSTNSYQVK